MVLMYSRFDPIYYLLGFHLETGRWLLLAALLEV